MRGEHANLVLHEKARTNSERGGEPWVADAHRAGGIYRDLDGRHPARFAVAEGGAPEVHERAGQRSRARMPHGQGKSLGLVSTKSTGIEGGWSG